MRNWIADLRYGFRAVRRSPGFALGTILVLALGIGANTAIFSIVNAALLRPLPYEDASRLMQVWHVPPAKSFPGLTLFSVSPANYLDWQRQSTSFEAMAAYGGRTLIFGGKGQPEAVLGATVAPEFFSLLRAHTMLGRTFTADENASGAAKVVVLSYKFWRDHLGSDRSVVGHDITINSQPYAVVGVMPENFRLPDWAQVWVPLGWSNQERVIRGNHITWSLPGSNLAWIFARPRPNSAASRSASSSSIRKTIRGGAPRSCRCANSWWATSGRRCWCCWGRWFSFC